MGLKINLKGDVESVKSEIRSLIDLATQHALNAKRRRDADFQRGRKSGLCEALELVDVAHRSQGHRVVEFRQAEAIIKDMDNAIGVARSTLRTLTKEGADMAEAHAEGFHDELPREGCPECAL